MNSLIEENRLLEIGLAVIDEVNFCCNMAYFVILNFSLYVQTELVIGIPNLCVKKGHVSKDFSKI